MATSRLRITRRRLRALALAAALAVAPAALAQDFTFTKVADELTPVPGKTGEVFAEPGGDGCRIEPASEAPALDAGRVLFHSYHDPSFDRGLYLWEAGAISVVVDDATEPPGEDSPFISLDESPTLDGLAAGFRSGFASGTRRGIFHWQDGTITLVAAEGEPSLSTPGASVMSVEYSPSVEGGMLAFIVQDDSATQVEGVYLWDGSTVTTIADESTEAPGQPGKNFTNFERVAPVMEGGRVVFWGETTTDLGGGGTDTNQGLYLWDGMSLVLVVDENTPVPGRPSQTFADLDDVSPAFDGDTVYFLGTDRTPTGGGGSSDFVGIYAWNAGTLSVVATQDTPLPGGGTVGAFIGNLSGSGGRVLFETDCVDLYLAEDGVVQRVLGAGDLLDGQVVEEVWGGRQALAGLQFAINVKFEGGEQDAVYLGEVVAPVPLLEVPTLSQWGLGLLALLLALAAATRLGRRRPVVS
jgi:hypothetical protein